MKPIIERAQPFTAQATIEIPAEKVDEALVPLLNKLNQKGVLKGFRPGKAPVSQLLNKFKANIQAELFGPLIATNVINAIWDAGLEPLTDPVVEPGYDLRPGKPLTLIVSFFVRDDVELPDFSTLSLKQIDPEPTQKQIDDVILTQRKRLATISDVDDPDYLAKVGDQVTCSFLFPHGDDFVSPRRYEELETGIPIPEGLSEADLEGLETLEAGDQNYGMFAIAVIDSKVGDNIDLPVVINEKMDIPSLRGKEIIARAVIRKIKRLDLPDFDDDFIMTLGIPGLNTVDEFLDRVKKSARFELESWSKNFVRAQLNDWLAENIKLKDLPEALLQNRIATEMAEQWKVYKALVGKEAGKTVEEWYERNVHRHAAIKTRAISLLKGTFALDQLAERESLKPSDSEVEDQLKEALKGFSRKELQKEDAINGYRKNIQATLRRQMATDWIIDKAHKTTVSQDEVRGFHAALGSTQFYDLDDDFADGEEHINSGEKPPPLHELKPDAIGEADAEAERLANESLKAEREALRAERKEAEKADPSDPGGNE